MTLIPLNSETCKIATNFPKIVHSHSTAYLTGAGAALLGDSQNHVKKLPSNSIDLIFTSPPFALRRKKKYGNEDASEYVNWFLGFARDFRRVLKDSGSLVIDIGGSWTPGEPTKSLYHYRLLLALVDKVGFHLAQEIFWYNDARLPTPAQWVCRERVRLKDAVNMVWWLSKTPHPKADNKRVLTKYKPSQLKLIKTNSYNRGLRPSEHHISDKFGVDNGGAIAPNFLDQHILESLIEIPALKPDTDSVIVNNNETISTETDVIEPNNLIRAANTSATDKYLKGCKAIGAQLHPARIPQALPEFFIRFLTEPGDVVLDPFSGSNVTGAVAENLDRIWIAVERDPNYLFASQTRFVDDPLQLLTTQARFKHLASKTESKTGLSFSYTYNPPQPKQGQPASGDSSTTTIVEDGLFSESPEKL